MIKEIGIIGFGTMGAGLAGRLQAKYKISVFEKFEQKVKDAAGITAAASIGQLMERCEVIIIAVKPQDIDDVLEQIKPCLRVHLLVSIAAGIPTQYIEKRIGSRVRVVRVMPNLAVKVGRGMSVLCKGAYAMNVDLAFTQNLFSHTGKTLAIDEKMMDTATAVSGSGPGFLFELLKDMPREQWKEFGNQVFTPRLYQIAQKVGFDAQQAWALAETTVDGSLALIEQTKQSPELLRIKVSSKGGTTEAGLKALASRMENLEAAVEAARQRAQELARKD
jgi:pyrroline-5-carboxylate reductase